MVRAGLALLSFALAFAQRPGETTADTKIDLHIEPVRFLGEVAEVWSSSGGLGQVQAGQYSGYLWPMGPFFALGDLLGLPAWLVHRLWLGLLLAIAAWGVVKLLEALLERPRPVALAVGGTLFVVNPYVTTFTQVTSVTLLGYLALPWLMLAVHRGLRRSRRWWWPAAFALVFTSTGGGVNAAVTGWLLVGPLLLLGFEWWSGAADRQAAWALAWRTALVTAAASAWWIVPVAIHAAAGINFLPFTESAGAIWTTTSISESLRLMGYWLSYLGAGFGQDPLAYFDASRDLLFARPVVIASLVVPALAVSGLVWTRRWRYAPFFLLLLLAGLLAMSAGFPEGTPLRRGLTYAYNEIEPLQFLRTTYKAGPLVALALACLGAAAAQELWRRLRAPGARAAAVAAGVALVAVSSWPLVSGQAVDPKFTFEHVPSGWREAAKHVDSRLGPNARALILPGQLYAFYDWGATVDPILPALAERPVASRTAVPYADLHAVDALWTVDAGIQQERFVPGQLRPLLQWLAAAQVVTGTDDAVERSGATAPLEAARALQIAGLGEPEARFGATRLFRPSGGSITEPRTLPRVLIHHVERAELVRLEPPEGGVLLDGSAEGVAALAAFGGLDPHRRLSYAGDHDARELASLAATADEIVITDSNRRRIVSPARPRQSWGRTLSADEPVPVDAVRLEPFAERGPDAQTVAVVSGVDYLRSPFAPGFPQFPEHRPFAAFDGDARTWWEPDRELQDSKRWIEVGFERPRDVPWVDVLLRQTSDTRATTVELAGRRFPVKPGWNRLELGLSDARRLRLRIADRALPEGRHGGPGAVAEIRVPGLRVDEHLRPPRRLEQAARSGGVATPALTYLFARSTGDRPFRREPARDPDAAAVPHEESVEPALIREARDAEQDIVREIDPPAARRYEAAAWASVATAAPDPALDRLAGYRGSAVFRSSGRYEGRPGARASSAFDGDPGTAWVARATAGNEPWLEWRVPAKRTLGRLRLDAPRAPAELPTRVRLRVDGRSSGPLDIAADGLVRLPAPVTGRVFRLEVAQAAAEAVGIASVRGATAPRVEIPRTGDIRGSCGNLRIFAGGKSLALRAEGRIEELDAAFPLRAAGCGRLRLPAGRQRIAARGGTFLPYLLQLRSAASLAAEPEPLGAVVDPGEDVGSARRGVRLELARPARLVLAESFNKGWRASCDGDDLGESELAAGYANSWKVERGCRDVELSFAPQRAASAGYVVSGMACLLLIALLLLRRHGRRPETRAAPREPGVFGVRPRPLLSAAALALPLAGIVAFVFALRAGAVALPLLTFVLWRGASIRALLLSAGMLVLVAVPLLYALFLPEDRGGYNSSYAADIISAHWVSVGAFTLLALALAGMLGGRGRGRIR